MVPSRSVEDEESKSTNSGALPEVISALATASGTWFSTGGGPDIVSLLSTKPCGTPFNVPVPAECNHNK